MCEEVKVVLMSHSIISSCQRRRVRKHRKVQCSNCFYISLAKVIPVFDFTGNVLRRPLARRRSEPLSRHTGDSEKLWVSKWIHKAHYSASMAKYHSAKRRPWVQSRKCRSAVLTNRWSHCWNPAGQPLCGLLLPPILPINQAYLHFHHRCQSHWEKKRLPLKSVRVWGGKKRQSMSLQYELMHICVPGVCVCVCRQAQRLTSVSTPSTQPDWLVNYFFSAPVLRINVWKGINQCAAQKGGDCPVNEMLRFQAFFKSSLNHLIVSWRNVKLTLGLIFLTSNSLTHWATLCIRNKKQDKMKHRFGFNLLLYNVTLQMHPSKSNSENCGHKLFQTCTKTNLSMMHIWMRMKSAWHWIQMR